MICRKNKFFPLHILDIHFCWKGEVVKISFWNILNSNFSIFTISSRSDSISESIEAMQLQVGQCDKNFERLARILLIWKSYETKSMMRWPTQSVFIEEWAFPCFVIHHITQFYNHLDIVKLCSHCFDDYWQIRSIGWQSFLWNGNRDRILGSSKILDLH